MGAQLALTLLFGLLDRATQISALLQLAQSENRDVTPEELDALVAGFDAANAELSQAIKDNL